MATEKLMANHILVGLGGTGGKILREFKKRLFEEFKSKEEIAKQPIAILYVDSTDEMMPKNGKPDPRSIVLGKDASFTPAEFLNIKGVDVDYILSHSENYNQIKGIVSNAEAVKSAIGNLGEAAGQKRRAGRLLFAVNADKYVRKLKTAFGQCQTASKLGEKFTYIHILTGLSGGTGSGSIIDVIVQTRKTFPGANISVYAMIPESHLTGTPNKDASGRYYPNGYAALRELNALQTGRWFPQDVTGEGESHFYNDRVKGVANGLTLYSYENENGFTVDVDVNEGGLPQMVSDYLFARILMLDESEDSNKAIKDAYAFENIDDDALEYDENTEEMIVARTRKINSFGIKRIIYPTTRMEQHITYTIGRSILNQFRYNYWRDNEGYVDEESNRDYRQEFLTKENLQRWMLDDEHLTLEKEVLGTKKGTKSFYDYWHGLAVFYADDVAKEYHDRPLQELGNIMDGAYQNTFRDEGVEGYYRGKKNAIPDMAKEIRRAVERELFGMWKQGGENDISIVGLLKVSKLLLEKISEIRNALETKRVEEKETLKGWQSKCEDNVKEWSRVGWLKKTLTSTKTDLYAGHIEYLTRYYESMTMLRAWEFAKILAKQIETEFRDMDDDISRFSAKINDAIKEAEKLMADQRKKNNGLDEDKEMKGIVIEVSEDEEMESFEKKLKAEKHEMIGIAQQIRQCIFPDDEFIYFGKAADISMEKVKNAFDTTLMEIVRNKHDEIVNPDKKVLGLNILTQLRQQLKTEEDMRDFANKILNQSGVFLKLDQEQILLELPNNDSRGMTWGSILNKKVRLVSMPAPDTDQDLGDFADKLERALKEVDNTIIVNKKSPRREELSVITVSYCYPMRAISWLRDYKKTYEKCINTGNMNNAILLHSEGTGEDLPSLFAYDADKVPTKATPNAKTAPPAIPGAVPPPMAATPINLFIAIGGKQYGPYNADQCKQMVASGQLTRQSMVWMEGLAAWTAAGQVPALATLFAPAPPTNMPPLPPTGGPTPPPMM